MSEFAALGNDTVRWPRPGPELLAVTMSVAAPIATNAMNATMITIARRRRLTGRRPFDSGVPGLGTGRDGASTISTVGVRPATLRGWHGERVFARRPPDRA